MAIHTYGANAVDWEQRVDLARLRTSGWPGCEPSWRPPRWARC